MRRIFNHGHPLIKKIMVQIATLAHGNGKIQPVSETTRQNEYPFFHWHVAHQSQPPRRFCQNQAPRLLRLHLNLPKAGLKDECKASLLLDRNLVSWFKFPIREGVVYRQTICQSDNS